jgi:hypothetical protein
MNPGKRYLRNTVFVLWGAAAFFIAWSRLYASVGTEGPEWKRNLLSLGLRVEQESKPRPELDLATAKDFSKVSAYGNFTLEIVGSAEYKVTFTPPAGTTAKVHASLDDDGDGYLRVHTEDSVTGGTLHIEVPSLERIDANVPNTVVRGVKAKELRLVSYRGGTATLQQNQVQSWSLFSGDAMDVRVDDATFAAGSIKSNGNVVIRRDQ